MARPVRGALPPFIALCNFQFRLAIKISSSMATCGLASRCTNRREWPGVASGQACANSTRVANIYAARVCGSCHPWPVLSEGRFRPSLQFVISNFDLQLQFQAERQPAARRHEARIGASGESLRRTSLLGLLLVVRPLRGALPPFIVITILGCLATCGQT